MTHRIRFKRVGVVAVVVAAAALPEIALASTAPKKGAYIGGVVTLKVASTTKSMKVQSSGYCHKWSIAKVAVKHGKFSFTGSATNGAHATLNGSFVTARRAKGTVKVGSCAKKTFTARYSRGY